MRGGARGLMWSTCGAVASHLMSSGRAEGQGDLPVVGVERDDDFRGTNGEKQRDGAAAGAGAEVGAAMEGEEHADASPALEERDFDESFVRELKKQAQLFRVADEHGKPLPFTVSHTRLAAVVGPGNAAFFAMVLVFTIALILVQIINIGAIVDNSGADSWGSGGDESALIEVSLPNHQAVRPPFPPPLRAELAAT